MKTCFCGMCIIRNKNNRKLVHQIVVDFYVLPYCPALANRALTYFFSSWVKSCRLVVWHHHALSRGITHDMSFNVLSLNHYNLNCALAYSSTCFLVFCGSLCSLNKQIISLKPCPVLLLKVSCFQQWTSKSQIWCFEFVSSALTTPCSVYCFRWFCITVVFLLYFEVDLCIVRGIARRDECLSLSHVLLKPIMCFLYSYCCFNLFSLELLFLFSHCVTNVKTNA